jgi:hypothetical protein
MSSIRCFFEVFLLYKVFFFMGFLLNLSYSSSIDSIPASERILFSGDIKTGNSMFSPFLLSYALLSI